MYGDHLEAAISTDICLKDLLPHGCVSPPNVSLLLGSLVVAPLSPSRNPNSPFPSPLNPSSPSYFPPAIAHLLGLTSPSPLAPCPSTSISTHSSSPDPTLSLSPLPLPKLTLSSHLLPSPTLSLEPISFPPPSQPNSPLSFLLTCNLTQLPPSSMLPFLSVWFLSESLDLPLWIGARR